MEYTFAGLPLPLRIKPPYPLTDEELIRLSREHQPVPIERDAEGYLLFMTPAGSISSNKNAYLSAMLYVWAEEDGSGVSFDSSGGFTLPDGSMRAPDGAWIPLDRWNAISYEQQVRYAPICPDFIIELRSESDSLAELKSKMESWIINGTQLAWLLDPFEKAVTVYRPNREPERLDTLSEIAGEGPVAGFVLPLDRIFR